jgi:hypothetical protein
MACGHYGWKAIVGKVRLVDSSEPPGLNAALMPAW